MARCFSLLLTGLLVGIVGCGQPQATSLADEAPTRVAKGQRDTSKAGSPAAGGAKIEDVRAALSATEEAPAEYKVKFETTAGDFVLTVHRDWAPKGADRFYHLVKSGFYDGTKFFRVIPGFMVQWGMSGNPEIQAVTQDANIPDDPVKESNIPGRITFAKSGLPNSRTTQVFINYGNNSRLDSDGFAPFGEVVEGMDVVKKINSETGERPDQGAIAQGGNEYLESRFPNLDGIKKATIVTDEPAK